MMSLILGRETGSASYKFFINFLNYLKTTSNLPLAQGDKVIYKG
jgi:hypothetical protein